MLIINLYIYNKDTDNHLFYHRECCLLPYLFCEDNFQITNCSSKQRILFLSMLLCTMRVSLLCVSFFYASLSLMCVSCKRVFLLCVSFFYACLCFMRVFFMRALFSCVYFFYVCVLFIRVFPLCVSFYYVFRLCLFIFYACISFMRIFPFYMSFFILSILVQVLKNFVYNKHFARNF